MPRVPGEKKGAPASPAGGRDPMAAGRASAARPSTVGARPRTSGAARDRVATSTLRVTIDAGAQVVEKPPPAARPRAQARVRVTPFSELKPLAAEPAKRRRDRLSFVTTFARPGGARGVRDAFHTPRPRPVTAPLPDDVLFSRTSESSEPAGPRDADVPPLRFDGGRRAHEKGREPPGGLTTRVVPRGHDSEFAYTAGRAETVYALSLKRKQSDAPRTIEGGLRLVEVGENADESRRRRGRDVAIRWRRVSRFRYCGGCAFADADRCTFCMQSKLTNQHRLPLDRLASLHLRARPDLTGKEMARALARFATRATNTRRSRWCDVRRAAKTSRGDAAAPTRIFRGDESRRRP